MLNRGGRFACALACALIGAGLCAATMAACISSDVNLQPPELTPHLRSITEGERPEDHTPWFRKHHAQAASSADAKCGYCHTGLSGSARDNCQECHATALPRDHGLRWRGVEHGRQAALDARRCSTCHEIDECSTCHSVAPPSHSPLSVFRYRHERQARINERSCLTCHSFESTCAGCHTLDATPSRSTSAAGLRARGGFRR